jgi:putative phosphoribosyl transferase
MALFENRVDAGRQLAERLSVSVKNEDVLILALPRGGVPVAFEVAQKLHAPMTVFLVRKLGLPGEEELAMGALAENGVILMNERIVEEYSISQSQIDSVVRRETEELQRRLRVYREDLQLPDLRDTTVILVDDGIATGSTAQAAIKALRILKPKKLILATPVAAEDALEMLSPLVDEICCLSSPAVFFGIGQFYEDFSQTTDEQVLTLLGSAAQK